MALEYATDLRIFDATTAEDADPLRLIDAVASWGAVSDPLQEGEHVARRGHSANVSAVYAGGEDLAGWRLVLSHPDESDVGVTWTVTCTVTTGAGTHFALRLDRTRDGALIPLTSVPAPPGVLRDLLERDDLFAMDATFDLLGTHYLVTPERVDGFARFLLSPDRRLPVIGLSTRDNDWFDASKFVRDNIGVAHVAIVLPDSTWSLSAQLPDGIGVYGGAARVWWPGLTAGSVRWDHPLWVGDREASQVRRQVGERIRSVATAATAEDVRWTRLARERRTRELESFRSEAQQLAERLAATTPAEGVPTDWAAVEQIRADAGEQFGLAMQMLEDAALEVELEQQLAAAEKQRADAAEAAVRRLEAERDFYKDAVDRLGTSIGATDMPEVEQSLRREIGMYR